MIDYAAKVRDWIRVNVPGTVEGWLESYLDDDSVGDEELLDLTNWDVAGAVKHIENMLEDVVMRRGEDDYVEPESLEDAFGLNGPGGEWFYSQLIEFFHENDSVAARKDKLKCEAHVEAGGAAALYEGAL